MCFLKILCDSPEILCVADLTGTFVTIQLSMLIGYSSHCTYQNYCQTNATAKRIEYQLTFV